MKINLGLLFTEARKAKVYRDKVEFYQGTIIFYHPPIVLRRFLSYDSREKETHRCSFNINMLIYCLFGWVCDKAGADLTFTY